MLPRQRAERSHYPLIFQCRLATYQGRGTIHGNAMRTKSSQDPVPVK